MHVQVVADVAVKGASALGLEGTVTDVWAICETDPACCCAELATDATVTVRLDGRYELLPTGKQVEGYFAEDELARVQV